LCSVWTLLNIILCVIALHDQVLCMHIIAGWYKPAIRRTILHTIIRLSCCENVFNIRNYWVSVIRDASRTRGRRPFAVTRNIVEHWRSQKVLYAISSKLIARRDRRGRFVIIYIIVHRINGGIYARITYARTHKRDPAVLTLRSPTYYYYQRYYYYCLLLLSSLVFNIIAIRTEHKTFSPRPPPTSRSDGRTASVIRVVWYSR